MGGLRNFPQITEGQGDVLGEFSQSQSKVFFQCFLEKNYIPGKGINIKVGSHNPIFHPIIFQPTFEDNNWMCERQFLTRFQNFLCIG